MCGKSSAITYPYQKRDLETNTKYVLVMRAIGKGRAGLETFCGMMGMLPPVSQRVYTTENQKLCIASGEEREASFADAAAELRKDVPEDQVLDIILTCDGTLARRGFQSLYSIVVVASWKTSKVLDVEVLSQHCQACATPWNGYFLWWIFGLVGGSPAFMRGKLLWFILCDGVNWSPCNLDIVYEQE